MAIHESGHPGISPNFDVLVASSNNAKDRTRTRKRQKLKLPSRGTARYSATKIASENAPTRGNGHRYAQSDASIYHGEERVRKFQDIYVQMGG
jgi:hypothetical protein